MSKSYQSTSCISTKNSLTPSQAKTFSAFESKSASAFDSLGNISKLRHPPNEATKKARLFRNALQDSSADLLPQWQVSKCCRSILKHENYVTVNQHANGSLSYGNVVKCHSVWTCPVCSSKISLERAQELGLLIDSCLSSGEYVSMLTLTFPHSIQDDPGVILPQMLQAKRLMQKRKPWQRFSKEFGLVGDVRCLEVTHGQNGWHPHFHLLLFTKNKLMIDYLQSLFLAMWQDACETVGLPQPSKKHGIHLNICSKSIKDYVTKFGFDCEMSMGQTKSGRDKNRAPFQLLADYHEGDKQAGALFVKFAHAFKGRQQLKYSKGLKAYYALPESLTDQEINEQPEDTKVIQRIDRDCWSYICKTKKRAVYLSNLLDEINAGRSIPYLVIKSMLSSPPGG